MLRQGFDVQVNVRLDERTDSAFDWQHLADDVQRNSIQIDDLQAVQITIAIMCEKQGAKEVSAELSVGNPGGIICVEVK